MGVAESVKSREWPLERFSQLADRLLERNKNSKINVNHFNKIIFVGGNAEREMIEKVISKMKKHREKAVNLAGKTSLKELFYIISKCKIFISNDTGPMHIAAAQGCGTIGLFGPNTPVLWSPYGRNKNGKNNIAIFKGPAVCEYCPCKPPHSFSC